MCNILLASWRTSTAKGTQAHGKHGLPGVVKGENVPVNDIMDFLSFQFQQRYLAYQTIGIYKSCISRFYGLVEGQPVRSLPVMSRFMKGIFELQPPKPKTKTTWSVGQIVVFRQDMNPFGNLSLQDVSLKLAMLSFNFGSSCALTLSFNFGSSCAWTDDSTKLGNYHQKQDCWRFILPIHD